MADKTAWPRVPVVTATEAVYLSKYLDNALYASTYDAVQAAIDDAQDAAKPLNVDRVGTLTLTKSQAGALKIAAGKPLRFVGPGKDLLTFVLTPSVPRLFDLDPQQTAGQTFRDIHISGFSVDADVTYLDAAPLTEVTTNTTLSADQWTTVPVADVTPFLTAALRTVWCPDTNSGTASEMHLRMRISGGNLQVFTSTERTLLDGDEVSGGFLSEHCLIGNRHSTALSTDALGNQLVTHFRDITIEDIDVDGLPAVEVDTGLGGASPSLRFGVAINAPAAGSTIERVTYRRLGIDGGDCGTWTVGAAGTWIDEVLHEDCSHDRGAATTHNYSSLNFMVGQDAWVGRVYFRGKNMGRNSGDVGIEVDQAMVLHIGGETLIEDAYSGNYYFTNFVAPAHSIAGPPTAEITTGGGINDSATSVAVDEIPSEVDQEGYAKIGDELVHYDITGTTALRLKRAQNGSTAATHAQGATITFMLNRRQVFEVHGRSRRVSSATSRGLAMFTNDFLPLPSVKLRGSHERLADNAIQGECGQITGICSLLDIDDYVAAIAGNTAEACALFLLDAPSQTYSAASKSAEKVRVGSGVEWRVSGVASAGSLSYFQFNRGNYYVEADGLQVYNGLRGLTGATNVFKSGSLSPCTIGGRFRIKVFNNDNCDGAMCPVELAGLTTLRQVELDLDLFNMHVAGGTGSTNYRPYVVGDSSFVTVRRIIHPFSLGFTVAAPYPEQPERWASAKSAAYTANHRDRIIPCDTNASSAGVAITLPALSGGNASVGPKPGSGARVTVLDVSNAAGAKNITIAPATGEKINGVTNGTQTISTNGGKLTLIGDGTLGWWTM